MIKFNVTGYSKSGQYINVDCDTAQQAQDTAEHVGSATVIKLHGYRNMPDRLPEIEYKSCGLWSYTQANGWREHGIYDGYGNAISNNSPTQQPSFIHV